MKRTNQHVLDAIKAHLATLTHDEQAISMIIDHNFHLVVDTQELKDEYDEWNT